MGAQYYSALDNGVNFELMSEAKPGWARLPVHWSRVEPVDLNPDQYEWYSYLDKSLVNANEAGVKVLLTIVSQPDWVSDYPMGPPKDEKALLEFVGALVERFDRDGHADAPGSPEVTYFELYNEPDNTSESRGKAGTHGYWGNRGTEYARLLQKLYPVVKSANPNAQLVMGGIALDWFVEDGGVFDRDFLTDVLAECQRKKCIDVVNFHYYPLFQSVWAPYGTGLIGKTNYVRQMMAKYGMEDHTVFCTEIGWAGSESTVWGSVEAQARYAVQGFVRGLSTDLSMIIWFKAHDRGMEHDLPGLLDADMNPKPSYYAFKTTSLTLSGATYMRDLLEADTGSIRIEGYMFKSRFGRRLDVVWTTDDTPLDVEDDPIVTLNVNAGVLTVIDKVGNEWQVQDGDDGKIDGRVTLQVGGSPLFLEY
jgi:hypothetical protein